MTRKVLIGLALAAAIGVAVFWLLTRPATIDAAALGAHTPDLANGRTLFFAGGCASCHATPKQENRLQLGGGLALHSPFGTFYAPNISPDRTNGTGAWNEAQFVTAMTKGVSPAGEHYYPAFPYTSYQRLRTTDLRDLFAFLQTLPAVKGEAPAHDLPFPFTLRRGLGIWKLLYVDGKPFAVDPAQSAAWNRGAYLTNAAAHCAECHSPRDALGGVREAQRFAGGPDSEGGEGWVPNITQARLGDWSMEDIADLLTSGRTPDGNAVGGSMRGVIRNTAELPEADRVAIATYIKSLPAVEGPSPPERP